jgi:hypothetical protein
MTSVGKSDELLPAAVHRIDLDFAVTPRIRYGWGSPTHPQLTSIIEQGQERYIAALRAIVPLIPDLSTIASVQTDDHAPHWINNWFPAFDAAVLYGTLIKYRPRRYIEIGSGISTKFARRAINYHRLETKILSIDPLPRSSVDELCNEILRCSLEETTDTFWEGITNQDVIFFDGSHRAFQNSDVTVFFTEILPTLPTGTLVGIHDIFLPHDYPEDTLKQFYSEQYLLACWLLAGSRIRIELPVLYCSKVPVLHEILAPLWQHPNLNGANFSGGGFWFTCS